MSWYEGRDPVAPYCADEEAQRLRDLWRPGAQANYRPLYRRNPQTGEPEMRPDDYDPSQTSLWVYHPMYVIPPAVASPLSERLAQLSEHDRGMLFEHYGGWEKAVLHGAQRFLQRFFRTGHHRNVTSTIVRAYGDSGLSTNFDENGPKSAAIDSPIPRVGVPAPLLERHFPSAQDRVPIYRARRYYGEDADPYKEVTEDVYREGILGWTIPRADRKTNAFVFSLFRAKNHLVSVNWYDGPPENLAFTFRYPQLSHRGQVWLEDELVELEHFVPQGTDYGAQYEYHPRSDTTGHREWQNTDEQRKKQEAMRRYYASRTASGYLY